MKRAIALTFTALILSGISAMAEEPVSMTLQDCLEAALSTSPRLRASFAMVEKERAAYDEARSARFPELSLDGNYSYVSETLEFGMPPIQTPFGTIETEKVSFGDGNNYDFALQAAVPLFTGGALSSRIKAEDAVVKSTTADLAKDSLDVAFEVRRAYYNVLGLEAALTAARNGESRLKRHVDELQAAIDNGTATRENLLQALSRLKQAERKVLQAETNASNGRLALGALVGRPGKKVNPEGGLGDALPPNAAKWNFNDISYLELTALDHRKTSTQHLERSLKGSFWPSVFAQAAYHYGKPGVDVIANEWDNYATVGVKLTWTLWDWNNRGHKIEQVRAAGRNLDAKRAQLSNALRLRLARGYNILEGAAKELESAKERLQLEKQRSALVEKRFEQGQARESELLDTYDDVTLAETELALARTRLRIAEAEIIRATEHEAKTRQ